MMMSTESRIAAKPRTVAGIARSTLTVVLIVLSVVSLTLSPLTIWARNLILDTDGLRLHDGPARRQPSDAERGRESVEKQVDEHLNIQSYLSLVLPPKAVQRLGPTLKKATLSLVTTVTTKFVQSPQFQELWNRNNRIAHQQVASLLLTGATVRGVIKVKNDNIVLDLSQVVSVVKQRLVSAGIGIAARVPTFGATITIAHLQGFSRIQAGVRALNAIANLLPWLGLALAAGALIAARRRRRAAIALALGLAGGMCAFALGLLVGAQLFTASLVARGLAQETATVLFDTVVRNLKTALRVILVCALVIAAAIWVSRFVLEIHIPRSAWDQLLVPGFVARNANPLRIGVVALPLAILILIEGPPLALVVTFACLVVVALGLLEVCCRAPRLGVPGPIATDQT